MKNFLIVFCALTLLSSVFTGCGENGKTGEDGETVITQLKTFEKQWGTSGNDYGNSAAVDSSDNIFITGATKGDLYAESAGESDIFLVKMMNE